MVTLGIERMVSLGSGCHWNRHVVSLQAMVSQQGRALFSEVCQLAEELVHHLQMKGIPWVSQNHRYTYVEIGEEKDRKSIGVHKLLVVGLQ